MSFLDNNEFTSATTNQHVLFPQADTSPPLVSLWLLTCSFLGGGDVKNACGDEGLGKEVGKRKRAVRDHPLPDGTLTCPRLQLQG